MAICVEVATLCGESFEVEAHANWRAWDLKLALQELIGKAVERQRLISKTGEELRDHQVLSEFCDAEPTVFSVTLYTMPEPPKSQAELEWLEKWATVTPAWLQLGTKKVLTTAEYPEHHSAHMDTVDNATELLILNTAKAVLEVVTRKGVDAVVTNESKDIVNLAITDSVKPSHHWLYWPGARAAVYAACEEAPRIMMPLVQSSRLAEEIVARSPGTFQHLSKNLQELQSVLYAALERDHGLRNEFFQTATRREINEWQWHHDREETQIWYAGVEEAKRRERKELLTSQQSQRFQKNMRKQQQQCKRRL
jgi:hypothetical protein|mmetsp:Transcript_90969/g.142951  ORF Transcript_90969/g.142951 Transcript_90969/m.142951 type:complete len:309 (+) Transcript_90969:81-1007(+)